MKNVVATGQGLLSKKHLEGLSFLHIETIILSLDNDSETKAGEKNTHRSIELLQEKGFRFFVVDPELLGEHKDPDSFVSNHGLEAYKKLIDNALSGAHWKAKFYEKSFKRASTDILREKCIEEAVNYVTSLTHPLDKEIFSKTFVESGVMSFNELLEIKAIREQANENERKAKAFLSQTEYYVREGALDKLSKHIKQSVQLFNSDDRDEELVPYSIDLLMSELSKNQEGLKMGYKDLDGSITIPREAITIVAGRPSHGKTTFLLNLLVNMVGNTPEQKFYFFSYEETCKQIALKLIKILGGYPASLVSLEEEMKLGPISSKIKAYIDKGKSIFEEWTSSGRLCLVDKSFHVDDLANHIIRASREGALGGVFIDYTQKIKIEGKFGTRQLELQKVSEKILEVAKESKAAVILGAQLGREKERRDKVRLDNLRECGDIEKDANLVLGILNKGMPDVNEGKDFIYEPVVDFMVSVLKNRNGGYLQNVPLEFHRNKLKILYKSCPTSSSGNKHAF